MIEAVTSSSDHYRAQLNDDGTIVVEREMGDRDRRVCAAFTNCCVTGTPNQPPHYTPVTTLSLGEGALYGKRSVEAYVEGGHGPDGAALLDPNIRDFLTTLPIGSKVLDAGCDGGQWSFAAAQRGMKVTGVDIQPKMIEAARGKTPENSPNFLVEDVTDLCFKDGFFNTAFSFLVGCGLNSSDLQLHFSELARTMKEGGQLAFIAPTSLGTLFTDGSQEVAAAKNTLVEALNTFNDGRVEDPTLLQIEAFLLPFKSILSATFVLDNHRLTLVTDEKMLEEGQEIFRLLPNAVVPNYYHSLDTYRTLLAGEGFTRDVEKTCQFSSEAQRKQYHEKGGTPLGEEYITHPIFVFWVYEKSYEGAKISTV